MKRLLLLPLIALFGCTNEATESPFVRLTCWSPNGQLVVGQVAPRSEYAKLDIRNLPCIIESIAALPAIPATPVATGPTPTTTPTKEPK